VTVQAEIIDLLVDLQEDFGTSIILITHDLGIVAGTCEDTLVMFGGKVMEYRKTADIFASPEHPYTKGLLAALPRLDKRVDRLSTVSYDFMTGARQA
jgi:oligopeptide transport system ATP-binding protein